jgi:2-keto-3-deoxy-L-rhamnonate aldolase RhmA
MTNVREILGDRTAIGVVGMLPDATVADLLARLDIDFLLIDAQHQGFNAETIAAIMRAGEGVGVPVLVRVSIGGYAQVELMLDLGASGIVFPTVGSPEEAQAAVDACRYPPVGRRSVGGLRSMVGAGDPAADALCIIQIERADAIERLPEIFSIDGIDAVFPGPVDLAASLGDIGSYGDMTRFQELVGPLVASIEEAAVLHGLDRMRYCPDEQAVDDALRSGCRIVTVAIDAQAMITSCERSVNAARGLAAHHEDDTEPSAVLHTTRGGER